MIKMADVEMNVWIVMFIIIVLAMTVIILFLMNIGVTSKVLGSMPYITAGVTALLAFLGLKP